MRKYIFITLFLVLLAPVLVSAHQPRLATGNPIIVTEPEVSKAYYGQLAGEPVIYKIHSDQPFALYVNILAPDIVGQKKDISALVLRDGQILKSLDGLNFDWQKFFEPFGHDNYWKGPEYKSSVPAGDYEIRVYSSNNDSKYSLAIGETESFSLGEIVNVYQLIPQLKRNFFEKSSADFIFSPFGWGLILLCFVLAFAFGFIYRFIWRRMVKSKVRRKVKYIGQLDRWGRVVLGVATLLLGISTCWCPAWFLFSGFMFFEAIFSWCLLYAALGKNTCPV